jgi:hypothetical protein
LTERKFFFLDQVFNSLQIVFNALQIFFTQNTKKNLFQEFPLHIAQKRSDCDNEKATHELSIWAFVSEKLFRIKRVNLLANPFPGFFFANV